MNPNGFKAAAGWAPLAFSGQGAVQRVVALTTGELMPLDMKVSIVEHVAPLILALDHSLAVAHYDIAQMSWSDPMYYPCSDDMFTLNALELVFIATDDDRYFKLSYPLRNQVLKRCDRLYGMSGAGISSRSTMDLTDTEPV